MNYSLEELQKIFDSTINRNIPVRIKYISIDSRTIISPDETLFFAMKGIRNNGHNFIKELINKGVKAFVISEDIEKTHDDKQPIFIKVTDTLRALQQFAIYHRKKFNYPVLGITGSNGKTVVKEWLYQALGKEKVIVRSPKSYNSQIGVPLSVCLMENTYQMAIFEAGISKVGEMKNLGEIIRPDIGIFTNIGEAHQENFKSHEQKVIEKVKLFKHAQHIIYCKDHELIHENLRKIFNDGKLLCWSLSDIADLQIYDIKRVNPNTLIKGKYKKKELQITIPFIDDASIENSIHVWLLLLHLGFSSEIIAERLSKLNPVAMRLELKQGINNCSIINDTYNSDINSIQIALEFLKQQNQNSKKTVILSDITQSGRSPEDLYQMIADLLSKNEIDKFIGIGNELKRNERLFKGDSIFFLTTDEFIASALKDNFNDEAILIKGSRKFEFEHISRLLEYKGHRTILEINLNNLIHNLNIYKSELKPETMIMVMVKALSYGSGSYEIASVLQNQKVDYLGVAFVDEGIELRDNGISLPVMVMQAEERSYENMIRYKLEPEIYNIRSLKQFLQVTKSLNIKSYPVHLKFDTGMHRMGFSMDDIHEVIGIIQETESILVKSVFSHLAASNEQKHDEFTDIQIKMFEKVMCNFNKAFKHRIIYHILNSEGIIRFPEAQFDMVRLGIGLHGISDSLGARLNPISTLRSRIIQIKRVRRGDSVGYGRLEEVHDDTVIGIVPIGYADGLSMRLGNGIGKFYVNHSYAPIIGNICMDVCMIDLSGIEAAEGDEVVIFGKEMPVQQLAKTLQTIPYEILTRISSRVKRLYIQE